MASTSAAGSTPTNSSLFWNRELSQPGQYASSTSPVTHPARVVSLSDPNDPANDPLHKAATLPDGVELVQMAASYEEFDLAALRDAKVNVAFVSHPQAREPLARLIQELPTLEWIHSRSAGVDFITSPTLETWQGKVTNAKGQFSSTLAEYTMLACSYFAKDLPRLLRNKKAKNWDKYSILELRKSVMGIFGFGDIGRACARLAKAYGMKVVALRRHPQPEPDLCDEVYGSSTENINRLFAECDYVVCAAPLTTETKGIIGKAQFDSVPEGKDVVFINVGRGPIVDEEALVEALSSGKLKGVGLDVFATEPLPVDSPLWEMDQVLLSPHNMDQTDTFMHESTAFFVEECLPRYVRGEPLLNPVNPKLGY